MKEKIAVVVTSIAEDTSKVLNTIAAAAIKNNVDFIVIGDVSSPDDFSIPGCDFLNIEQQQSLELGYSTVCPERSYARKNIGYLRAMLDGAQCIVETDDDNIPYPGFWDFGPATRQATLLTADGWINIYKKFTDQEIWPRGLPIQYANLCSDISDTGHQVEVACPIQQGLVDADPDVDAVYRMLHRQEIFFDKDKGYALDKGTWSPFNSQNTIWWRQAFPLLYLPATCDMRLTDIWRSFVAQRIAWECDWYVYFKSPTMKHIRNQHDLLDDFRQEVTGYLHNDEIIQNLKSLDLKKGVHNIFDNMFMCYEKLSEMDLVLASEIDLLQGWIDDISRAWSAK
jgi:hypothetical protein